MHKLYTDGSCLGNPGPGGWAAKCVGEFEIFGGEKHTTNNVMEMKAVTEGLGDCLKKGIKSVTVYTDSNYVKNGINSWIHKWKTNNWKTSTGSSVKNKEYWVLIDALQSKFDKIEWVWVKAHNGNEHNECVDKLARDYAKKLSA